MKLPLVFSIQYMHEVDDYERIPYNYLVLDNHIETGLDV